MICRGRGFRLWRRYAARFGYAAWAAYAFAKPAMRHGPHTPLFCVFGVMKNIILTVVLLMMSNVFMTVAWYGHLKGLASRPWYVAALASWGIALFEYLIQVPANRIGNEVLTIPQLKIMQEAISLTVFIPISIFFLKEKLSLDYVFAMLCIMGAVFFIFRARLMGG